MNELPAELVELICEFLDASLMSDDRKTWTRETRLAEELGFDGMDIADLCLWLEDQFDFDFDFDDVKKAATLGGLADLLAAKKNAQNSTSA